jgi:hypothetical protein
MRYLLVLLLPLAVAVTRSFAFGIQWPNSEDGRPTISAETEYQALVIVILCLTGLLATLGLMIRFPDLGALIADYNQF